MTDNSVAGFSANSIHKFYYSVQTDYERKKGGGLGRSEHSYWKHDLIENMISRQIPILKKRGNGCIIDMHAGDGCDTPHPQHDLFAGGSLKTTPTIALVKARNCESDVILCEKDKYCRDKLIKQFGEEAIILGNHNELLKLTKDLQRYAWLIILNDPNGRGDQGVSVMKNIASINNYSDFIIVFNRLSVKRCLGLKNKDHPRASVRGAYRSGIENKWMLEPENWKTYLGKRMVLPSSICHVSNAMEAQVLLVSNFIPGIK